VSSLPRLSRSSPLPSPSEITTSGSFADLESWEQTARQHIELAKRAFESWEYHREHFAASEVDLVDRLEGRGEGPDGTDLARGAWEEVRLRGEKAEAVLKRMFPHFSPFQSVSYADLETVLCSHYSKISFPRMRRRRRTLVTSHGWMSSQWLFWMWRRRIRYTWIIRRRIRC